MLRDMCATNEWGSRLRATSRVQRSTTTSGVQHSADTPGSTDGTQGASTSGVQDSAAGDILRKQIKYDVSDFLASCVRLCKELTDTHDVPLKTALAPFVDETGDDYGLGAGLCEDAQNGSVAKDAYVDVERTLTELARNACVGLARSGYFIYGYSFEDAEDCQASIYGNLARRRVPYSENRKEGAVPREFVRARRVGRICVETLKTGVFIPTKSETQRAGLTLRSMETAEIQPGHSAVATAGLRLLSFRAQRARITQSVLGPGNRDKIRICSTLLAREDHGADIVFNVANYGRNHYVLSFGGCVGQIILVGVGDAECEILDVDNARVCLDKPACALAASAETTAEIPSNHTRNHGLVTRVLGGPKQRACVILMLLRQNPAEYCSPLLLEFSWEFFTLQDVQI
jgi:dUTPase